MRKSEKKCTALYVCGLLFLSLLMSLCVSAQTIKLSGTVKASDNGDPIPGATVKNLQSGKMTVADKTGKFSINASVNDKLSFSGIGYRPDTITVIKGKLVYSITLGAREVNDLDGVVVVGYGTVKRKDITGSVASVAMKDLEKAPVKSFDDALAGRVAGVQVTSNDGQPGGNINIVIRGANSVTQDNSPLYVIDGFPIESPDNNALNPDDIESIEILKDASGTAIYGARGANGVILITTKRGKAGKPSLSLNTFYGTQVVRKKMDLMSPYDFVKYSLQYNTDRTPWDPATMSVSGGITPYQLYLSGGTTLDYYKDSAQSYDWQDAITRNAPMFNTTFNVRGGSNGTVYSLSGNIVNQDGIILNSKYKRYQGRASIDQTFNKKFKMGINANYSYMRQSGVIVGTSTNSATTNLMYSVWGYRTILASPASKAVTGVNDDLVGDDESSSSVDETVSSSQDYRFNPLRNLKNAYNDVITNNLIANAYAEYSILPQLKLRVSGGINNRTIRRETFNNSNTQRGNPYTNGNGPNGSLYDQQVNSWLNENTLTYNNTFNKVHSLNVLVGLTEQKGTSSNYGFSAIQVPNESLKMNALSQGTVASTTSTSSLWTMASYLARVHYGYQSRYLLTATFRSDGTSKFAADNHWSRFYSGALAWRFSKEKFLAKSKVLTDGKLRISYGGTGNNRVSDFAYRPEYSKTPSYTTVYTFSNEPVTGSVPTTIGNANIKWETTYQLNLGTDLSFFKDRISLVIDYYNKDTKDLLVNASIPTSTGYATVYKNIGSIQNKGLEFTLNTSNIITPKFRWTSTFNISFNKSKVLSLAEDQESLLSAVKWDNGWQTVPAYIAKLGHPLGEMYGYVWDGVYQYKDFDVNPNGSYTLKSTVSTNGNTRANIQPGDIKYKDLNGDKVVNAYDYTVIGRGLPVHIGGFGNNFTYGDFDLNVFFQWSYGNDIQNANRMVFEGNVLGKTYLNQFASYSNYWTPDNTQTDMMRVKGYYGGGYSSRTVEDGSFLRLKTVALGYTVPKKILKRSGLTAVRAYVSAQNMITWTKYSGIDPEVNAYSSVLTAGFDYSPYPRAKTFVFGVNVDF